MSYGFQCGCRTALLIVSLVMCVELVGKDLPDTVPEEAYGVTLVREFRQTKSNDVGKAIREVGGGMKPASVQRARDGRKFIHLPVTFGDGQLPRMTWDIDVKADWSRAASIVLDLIPGNVRDLSHLTFFAHSVNGWYAATFALDLYDDWTHVDIDKSEFFSEGKPESWKKIDRIRLSLWRRSNTGNGWLGLANVGIRKEKRHQVKVAVIRGDACNEHYGSTSKSFASYAESVLLTLDQCGIGAHMVSDRDVTAEILKRYRVVILPYNTWMPKEMIEALKAFVAQEGRIIGFFAMPDDVYELLGIRFAPKRWVKPPTGVFGGFLATEKALPGQPKFAHQNSYFSYVPQEGCGRVLATWAYADGRDSKIPSLVLLPKGAYVSHVWIEGAQEDRQRLLEVVINEFLPLNQVKRLKRSLKSLGKQDVCGSWESLVSEVRRSGNQEAFQQLQEAVACHDRAMALLDQGEWRKARPLVAQAHQAAKKAFFLTRRSKKGERRLVWCHNSLGVPGMTWDKSVRYLSECGFTDVLVNMCWSGCAYYNSKVLPRYGEYGKSGDRLKECLAACLKRHLACHVWKVCFKLGSHATQAFSDKMVREGRVQVSRNGKMDPKILCPTHPQNQREEIDTMVELVKRYPAIAGVHFDYIRFSDEDACFCPGCRRRFENLLGHKLPAWPFPKSDKALMRKWYDFRREAINHVVKTVHDRTKKIRPDIEISAAVYVDWKRDCDGAGQDVMLWCRKGWVDFVCPMNYRERDLHYHSLVKAQVERSYKVPVYPGIGLTCWKTPNNPYRLVRQIELGRRLGAKGFAIFDYCQGAMEPMKWLKYGCTKD